jgi:hypothetical protein
MFDSKLQDAGQDPGREPPRPALPKTAGRTGKIKHNKDSSIAATKAQKTFIKPLQLIQFNSSELNACFLTLYWPAPCFRSD